MSEIKYYVPHVIGELKVNSAIVQDKDDKETSYMTLFEIEGDGFLMDIGYVHITFNGDISSKIESVLRPVLFRDKSVELQINFMHCLNYINELMLELVSEYDSQRFDSEYELMDCYKKTPIND